jgi:transcriptional regulator with XRE-family HTH domain
MSVQLTAEQEIVRNSIRQWIRGICDKKGYKPANLAKESDLSASTVLRLLNDSDYRCTPSMTTLQKISSATGYALPDSLLNSNAPFTIYTGAQPGRKSNAEKAARETLHLPRAKEAQSEEEVIAQNVERLNKGIAELMPNRDRTEVSHGTGAGKAKAFADAVVSRARPAERENPVEEPARLKAEVEIEPQPRVSNSGARMIPLYTTSAFPASFQARRGDTKSPVTECPEILGEDTTAFAVKIGDNTLGPVIKPGSLAFGSRYRDPAAGDTVYIRRTDGRSFVRVCADINENGVVVVDGSRNETLIAFDDIEDVGVIGLVEMVGFF